MSKLLWDQDGERLYETGVSDCALYPRDNTGAYPLGVAWNGISTINKSPSGAEPSPIFADNIKYLNLMSAEELGGTIEAYMYPDEFAECDGSKSIVAGVYAGQQTRKTFGLAFKTKLGNDTVGNDFGYKLHIIYGALASPSEKAYATINDSPEAMTLSYEFSTTPVVPTTMVDGAVVKPLASLEFDSTKADPAKLAALETILYGKNPTTEGGNDGVVARLPLPDEIFTLFTTEG